MLYSTVTFDYLPISHTSSCFSPWQVDVDAASDVAKEYEVMSMPTFMFFKNGKVVARFSGASADKLRQIIETYI